MRSWWWKIRKRLSVLRRLQSLGDLFLFLRIVLFALAVPALLRLKLSRLETLLEPRHPPRPPEPARAHKIMDCVDAAIQVGRPLIHSGCLTRGITAYTFLRRAGLDVSLCFGIGKAGEAVAAHCWLVKDGKPFMEARDPRALYATMVEFHGGTQTAGAELTLPTPFAMTGGEWTRTG